MFKAWDETHDIPPLIPKTNTTPTKNKTAWHSGVKILNSSDFFYWFPLLENAQKESFLLPLDSTETLTFISGA